MRHTAAKAIAALAFSTALAGLATAPALADPPAGVTPQAQDIVGVGSDTTQVLLNQISADYNATISSTDTTTPRLYSWDATGSSPITPKAGGNSITRPNGSGSGIAALNGNTNTTLDFARSSRGPQTGDLTTDDFVAFAKDAVTWSALGTNGDAPANLTTADLAGIYQCTITDWNQITDVAGYTGPDATIKPYLPQSGSGTRSFFLSAIGGVTPGSCVTSGPEENEGTDAALNDPDVVFPYSVGHYVGQLNGHNSTTDNVGVLTLRQVNGVNPLTNNNTLNPVFAGSSYGRVLYNVVRDGDLNASTTQGTALRTIFGAGGYICSTEGATIHSYGFLTLPSAACGSVTHI